MPIEAKIVIMNDHPAHVRATSAFLDAFGHTVVGITTTVAESLALVPRLEEIGTQVVLLDGNFTKGDISGTDGRIIAQAIRQNSPEVRIVGYSASGFVEGAHINFDRRRNPPEDLAKLIAEL